MTAAEAWDDIDETVTDILAPDDCDDEGWQVTDTATADWAVRVIARHQRTFAAYEAAATRVSWLVDRMLAWFGIPDDPEEWDPRTLENRSNIGYRPARVRRRSSEVSTRQPGTHLGCGRLLRRGRDRQATVGLRALRHRAHRHVERER